MVFENSTVFADCRGNTTILNLSWNLLRKNILWNGHVTIWQIICEPLEPETFLVSQFTMRNNAKLPKFVLFQFELHVL